MGQTVRGHGIGADHCVVPRGKGGGEDGAQQLMGQAVAVRQLIHPVRLDGRRVPEGDKALMGDGGEKPLGPMALPLRWTLQLPADDSGGALDDPLLHRLAVHQLIHVPAQLPRRAQTAVHPFVVPLVFRRRRDEIPFQRLKTGPVVELAQVYVALHRAGAFGLHHVGGGYGRTLLGDKLFII